METAQHSAPDSEAQLNALQAVADYAPVFSPIALRAERGRVSTKYGRKIFDGDLRAEYEAVEVVMNGLLETLYGLKHGNSKSD